MARQQAEIAQANLAYGGRQAAAQMQSAALQAHQQALNTSIEGNARQMEQQFGYHNYQQQAANNNAMQQAEQHAELQSWVNSQEMTQADTMRLQRLQQGISAVQSDPSLNEADRMSLIGMMRSQIDPLQARQQLQQQKHENLQNQQIQQKIQQAKKDQIAAEQFEAKMKEDGVGTYQMVDPNTGHRHTLIQNPRDGSWYNPLAAGGAGSKGSKVEEAEATKSVVEAVKLKAEALFPDDMQAEGEKKAHPSQEVLAKRAEYVKGELENFDTRHEVQRPFTPGDTEHMTKTQRKIVEGLQEKLNDIEGRDDIPPEQKKAAIDAVHALHAELGKYGSFQKPGSLIKPADQKIIQSAQMAIQAIPKNPSERMKSWKPFRPGQPESMNEEQRTLVGGLGAKLSEIESRADIPGDKKEQIVEAIHGTHALMAKYGWIVKPGSDEMNPKLERDKEDRARAERYKKIITSIPSAIPDRVSQPAKQKVDEFYRNRPFMPRIGSNQP